MKTAKLFWALALVLPLTRPAMATPSYLVSIPPLKAILSELVRDRAETDVLLAPGDTPHVYEPKPSDARAAAEALALFYVHDDLDGWAAGLPSRKKVAVFDLAPAGFRLGWNETGLKAGKKSGNTDRARGSDPHFWLDPLTVRAIVPGLVKVLTSIDPKGGPVYKKNAARFEKELTRLNEELTGLLKPVKGRKALLEHACCRYFFRRYGIELAGLIESVPGKEPSVREMARLVKTAREQGVSAIFIEEQMPERAARGVAEASGVKLARVDPLGGVPGRKTYEELLRYNARRFLEALKP